MIRVGQMQLATALKRHQEEFATSGCSTSSSDNLQQTHQALHPLEHKFLDDKRSPFSIFRFIEAALGREVTATQDKDGGLRGADRASSAPHGLRTRQLTKKDAGDWFGPTTISETIAALVERSPLLCGSLAVYVNVDGMLYEDEVRNLAYGDESELALPLGQAAFVERVHRCGSSGDSDDEFTVVSTAPVMSATNLLHSPQLSTAPQSPTADSLDTGTELEELRELQLPPPVVETEAEFSMSEASFPAQQLPDANESEVLDPRWRKAVLLLFPKRLGLEKNVSKYYVNALLRYFELKASLGAMGGRPRMAHFFVGRQDRNLLYVDPHVVQPAALPVAEGAGNDSGFIGVDSFRNVPTVQAIPIEHIDSSVSLAFYCSSEEELAKLIEDINAIDRIEEDALLRCEPYRPPELRGQQVSRDSMCHDFAEVGGDFCNEVMELSDESPKVGRDVQDELMQLSGESPKAMNHRNSDGSFDFCENSSPDDAQMETEGVDVGTMQMIEPTSGDAHRTAPTMCVGSAWACIEAPP
jgi:hypothetical protein